MGYNNKVWSVKHGSPWTRSYQGAMTRASAIAIAEGLLKRHPKWHIWVERSRGAMMAGHAGEKIFEYDNGRINIHHEPRRQK